MGFLDFARNDTKETGDSLTTLKDYTGRVVEKPSGKLLAGADLPCGDSTAKKNNRNFLLLFLFYLNIG